LFLIWNFDLDEPSAGYQAFTGHVCWCDWGRSWDGRRNYRSNQRKSCLGCIGVTSSLLKCGHLLISSSFCWGLGGVAGAIVGATCELLADRTGSDLPDCNQLVESPAQKWPGFTQKFPFFATYPYALPCAVAASVTLIGSWVYRATKSHTNTLSGAVLSLFLGRDGGPREGAIRLPDKENGQPSPFLRDESPSPAPSGQSTPRGFHQKVMGYFTHNKSQDFLDVPTPELPLISSGATHRDSGSAYGYSRGYRPRLSSVGQHSMLTRALRRRRGTGTTVPGSFGQQFAEYGELNFAQRLLMANGMAVNNVSDLWVSAAMNVDEDVFYEDEEEGPYQHGFQESAVSLTSADPSPSRRLRRPSHRSSGGLGVYSRRQSGSTLPTIFANSGIRTPPPVILEGHQLLTEQDTLPTRAQLAAIPEMDHQSPDMQAPSLYSQLPIIFIVHYGLLALHNTTHDQVFYLYLVS